jgi:hypothetical protein
VTRRLAVEPTALVVLEPRFGRWHASADCPVLRAQPEAVVQLTSTVENVRACTICTLVSTRMAGCPPGATT